MLGIEADRRLVEDQQIWTVHERSCEIGEPSPAGREVACRRGRVGAESDPSERM